MDRTTEPKSGSGKDASSGWLAKKAQAAAPIRTRERGNGLADIGVHMVPKQQFSPLQALSHALGNQGFGRFIQAKLTIRQSGDHFEQEADQVAEQVMRMPDPTGQVPITAIREGTRIQRMCRECDEEMQKKEMSEEPFPEDEEPVLRAKEISSSVAVGPHLESRVNAMRGIGEPLPRPVRDFFEPRFGHDFSQVRIHTDAESADTAQNVNARAYTSRGHIVFAPDQYSPDTPRGLRLLAHELTHVVQQGVAVPLGRQSSRHIGPAAGAPWVQFDLARPVPTPNAVAALLTAEQSRSAIRFNQLRFADPYVFAVIRDVLGVSRFPAVVDEEFVQAIAQWQAENNLPSDGRLTPRTTATIVAELRAEGQLVPALLRDAVRVELEPAFTFNDRLNFDQQTIRILQGVVGAPATGLWDDTTIQRIMTFQRTNGLGVDGMVGPNTLRRLIETLISASQFDDTIHVIVNAFHFPTANLAAITFDATVIGADAVTSGTIGTGQPQTVRVGPTAFTAGFEHMIRIIGHELQHVQQRSGATPIANQHLREFLAFAWEALSIDSPPLAPAERVNHAQIAIQHWNQVPAADRPPHQAVRDRLAQLIAAGGVGNF